MLFLTDKKTMNFIVAYNMLKATNTFSSSAQASAHENVYLNQKLVQNDIQNLKTSL